MAKKNSAAAPARRRATASSRESASDPAPAPIDTATVAGTEIAEPSYDEIAQAAYLRYVSRGGSDGQDFDDWVEAERELKQRGNGNGTGR
jgi:hypothetical protein